MKEYGYARVSTQHQVLDRQIENIKSAYPNAIIYTEKYTGTKIDRPEFQRLLKQIEKDINAGEEVTLVFDEPSRMSRDAEEGIEVYQKLFSMGANLIFLKCPAINSSVYHAALNSRIKAIKAKTGSDSIDKFINGQFELLDQLIADMQAEQIKAAFQSAEDEVVYKRQAISEGIRQKQANDPDYHHGRKLGQKKETKKSKAMKEKIRKMSRDFSGTMSDKDIIEILGLARGTYYKYKKEMQERD